MHLRSYLLAESLLLITIFKMIHNDILRVKANSVLNLTVWYKISAI